VRGTGRGAGAAAAGDGGSGGPPGEVGGKPSGGALGSLSVKGTEGSVMGSVFQIMDIKSGLYI
jgi:hypothetical protein